MNQTIPVAVVGLGPMACDRHLPALSALEGVDLAGLCDRDEDRLRAAAARFQVPPERCFTDHRRLLETVRPDAVYAIMPPHHVVDLALEILDRGFALFIEKPPGISTAQAEAMARMAARNHAVSAVAFQRRFHPLVRACWDRVRAGRMLHRLRVHYHKWWPPQRGQPYYEGAIDILSCDAIHAVDAVRFYAGLADVRGVQASVRAVGAPFPNCYQALIEFENGIVAGLDADWSSGRRLFAFEFHAAGACGYADIDGAGRVWADDGAEPVYASTCAEAAGSADPVVSGGFLAEHAAFLEAVRTKRPPHNSLEDAVKTMCLADAIYANAEQPPGRRRAPAGGRLEAGGCHRR